MPRKSGTGGAARPTGETAVRRYTAEEWAERERAAQEAIGSGPGDARLALRLVLEEDNARVEIVARVPLGDGAVGQSIDLTMADEGVSDAVAACAALLGRYAARATGAATLAWARHVAAGEV